MSRIVVCDICKEPDGLGFRLEVPGPVYPHKGEMIVETEVVDVCPLCLRLVSDLKSSRTLEELQRTYRGRAEADVLAQALGTGEVRA